MKRGSVGIVVLVAVVAVLALGLVFVFTDNSAPTGYAGSPTGGITSFVPSNCVAPSCDTSSDCADFGEGCCEFGAGCDGETCACLDPCVEGSGCSPDAESPDSQCGGFVNVGDPRAKPCLSTNPNDGEEGGCDCDMDGCTEGASCTVFGETAFGALSHPYDNPCGENGHCEITGSDDGGMLTGQCVCGPKGCEFGDDEEKDQCPDTVKCVENAACTTSAQCGGPGVGACEEGFCDCDCVSWAPCEDDDDCGAGECVTGEDGSFECMCASEFGCSFDQCEPGVTPCDDSDDCFGGGCKTSGEGGVCEECGISCNIDCSGNGDCPEEPSQADCNAVGAAFGGASCTVDSDCDCILPSNACTGCVEIDGVFWCVD